MDFSINGIPSCANKVLLTDILRDEWNFKGIMLINFGVGIIVYYR